MSDNEESLYDERKRSHEEDTTFSDPEDKNVAISRDFKRPALQLENSKHFSMRCLVTPKEAGVIIGKGGVSIAKLRELSGARINISDSSRGSMERVLTVAGDSKSVSKAFGLLANQILNELEQSDGEAKKLFNFKLLIPHSKMGTVIGKAGSTIKEIQEKTSVRLNAFEEMLPQSTERILSLIGTTYQIEEALTELCFFLKELPERVNGVIYYSPLRASAAPPTNNQRGNFNQKQPEFNFNQRQDFIPQMFPIPNQLQQIYIPNEMVGCVIGKGGAKINEMRMMSGSNIKVSDPIPNSNERLISISGTPECNRVALHLLYTRLEQEKAKILTHGPRSRN